MYSDNFDSMTNNLRDSVNGSFVTSDDTFQLTGNSTGSVLQETIVVSRNDMRALLRGRTKEMPQKPEVPVEESLDCPASIASKEFASTHSVKNGTLQNACTTRPRVVVGLRRSAHSHIVRLMNSRRKRSKSNNGKSAVAILKKGNWQERERESLSQMLVTIERGNL